jgi:hypothetical protein
MQLASLNQPTIKTVVRSPSQGLGRRRRDSQRYIGWKILAYFAACAGVNSAFKLVNSILSAVVVLFEIRTYSKSNLS